MENMQDCGIFPIDLSEGTQLSRWDIRSSAASRVVPPTHYILTVYTYIWLVLNEMKDLFL
jgi:hypothetical protein